ncbi:hypothetical protein HaLaN_07551, partial [Haematococcus lacustris]
LGQQQGARPYAWSCGGEQGKGGDMRNVGTPCLTSLPRCYSDAPPHATMRILTSAYHSFVKNCRTFTTAAPGNSQFVTWPAGLAAGGILAIGTVGEISGLHGAIRKLEASVIRELRIAREEQYKHQVKMGEQMALLGEQMAIVLSKLDAPPAAAAQETTAAAAKTVVAQATAKQPAAVKTYGNHTTTNHHAAR